MRWLLAWRAWLFASSRERICMRCRQWSAYDPGIAPVGHCALDKGPRYAHQTCKSFDSKEAK